MTKKAEERKYRFTEIMSALEMLPALCEIEEHQMPDCECYDGVETPDNWKLPNGSAGIDDSAIRDALICQILKRDDDNFIMKSVGVFLNTAMSSIIEVDDSDDIKESDLELMGTTVNILWAIGNASGLFNTLGMLGRVCMAHGREIPEIATIVLKGNKGAKIFGQLDPYEILESNISRADLLARLKRVRNSMKDSDSESE